MDIRYKVKLGKYKGLTANCKPRMATEEEIDKFLLEERKNSANSFTVNGPAQLSDTVVIDYAGFLGDEQFEGGSSSDYPLELGSGSFIPGFEDQLVGASAGDSVDVHVSFPDPYHAPGLAGKAVVFKCKVHSVQRKQIPEADDEFAKNYGRSTYAELREDARAMLNNGLEDSYKKKVRDELASAIVNGAEIEIAPEFIEERMKGLLNALKEQLKSQGMSYEEYLLRMGADEAQMTEVLKNQAREGAEITVCLLAIAEAENISVSDTELEEELMKLAETYGMTADGVKLVAAEGLEVIREGVLTNKVMDFVVSEMAE